MTSGVEGFIPSDPLGFFFFGGGGQGCFYGGTVVAFAEFTCFYDVLFCENLTADKLNAIVCGTKRVS